MKYSRNAITQLKKQYKSVLLKCTLINAALFMAVAPAKAGIGQENWWSPVIIDEEGATPEIQDYWVFPPHISYGEFNINSLINLSTFDNNGTVNAASKLDNMSFMANFNNAGTVNTKFLQNNGTFNNTGTVNAEEAGEESGIKNSGKLMNAAQFTTKYYDADGQELVFDFSDPENLPDFAAIKSTEYAISATENTSASIVGDIINKRNEHAPIVEDSEYPFVGENPFTLSMSGGILHNNGTIEGDVLNAGTLYNGVKFTMNVPVPEFNYGEPSDYDEPLSVDLEEPVYVEPTITYAGNSSATINAKMLLNIEGVLVNGGTINAEEMTVNIYELENGLAMKKTETSLEPIVFADAAKATITSPEIYNVGYIRNAGTIKGDIYNLAFAYPDDESETGYEVEGGQSLVALYGGTIDGNVVSKVAQESEMQGFQEKFSKFVDLLYVDEQPLYVDPSEEPTEDPDVETVTESIDTSDVLYGALQTFIGDNKVTGGVSVADVIVNPNTTLTIGGDLRANSLKVGYEETADDEAVSANDIITMASIETPTENNTSLTNNEALPARLDIGANAAVVDEAYFSSQSTLALTVKNENEHGKFTAGKFNIEDGAKLEVTVMPGLTPNEEHRLQLLAVTEGEFDNAFTDSFLDEDGAAIAENLGIFENNMFKIQRDDEDGFYRFTQTKEAEDVPENKEYSGMAKAWLGSGLMASSSSLDMQERLANIAQYHEEELDDALQALAPENAPLAQATSAAVMGHIFGGVTAHLSKPKSGLSSGDTLNGVSAWGSTYYGKAKLDNRAGGVYGFDADSKGVTAGVDKQITSSVKLGLGVQYDESDIDAFRRDVDVDTTAVFGYGEYRPNNWYVSGVAAYGRSDYDETKNVAGRTVKASYAADLFGLQALTGYDFATRYAQISPNTGLRYNYIKRHGYDDGVDQKVSGSDTDVLTGVIGLKAAKDWGNFRPSAYVNLTYDFVSDRDSSTVALTNGASYTVSGKRLNQFGTEAGAALEYNYGGWSFIASYDYNGRKHFNSHLGMLTAKYSF